MNLKDCYSSKNSRRLTKEVIMKNDIDKRPINFYGLAIFLYLIKCVSTTSYIGNIPEKLKIEKMTGDSVEISWKYSIPSNEEVDFIIARRVSAGSWDESYGMTSYKYFMKN